MHQTAERHAGQAELFGHPKGLTVLFATEMWERFSYYGMASLLVLYLVKYLLLPGQVEAVIGYQAVKGALESIFGPLAPQPFASQIFGFYAGFAYLLPILGGYLADRFFGQRAMAIAGALLMAAGHFLMAVESMLFIALGVLVLGMGAFKPNVSTQVGSLYAPERPPSRPRLFDLLCGDQHRRISRAAGRRHARRRGRLALRLRGRRRGNADQSRDLPFRAAAPSTGRTASLTRAASGDAAVRPPRTSSDWRVAGGFPADRAVLGELRATEQYGGALGRGFHGPAHRSRVLAGQYSDDLVSRAQSL